MKDFWTSEFSEQEKILKCAELSMLKVFFFFTMVNRPENLAEWAWTDHLLRVIWKEVTLELHLTYSVYREMLRLGAIEQTSSWLVVFKKCHFPNKCYFSLVGMKLQIERAN